MCVRGYEGAFRGCAGCILCQKWLRLNWKVYECEALHRGRRGGHGQQDLRGRPPHVQARQRKEPGRAVQVNPIKPTLKPRRAKRLTLKYDELL